MERTVLQGAQIFDGTGAPPASADVAVEGESIVEVGVGLDGDRAVDLSGRWLMPGLIDCHVHVMTSTINLLKRAATPFSLQFYEAIGNLRATLRAGVTSVRDAGGADEGVKRAVDTGLIAGPRMRIAVQILSPTGGHADGWFPSGMDLRFSGEHPGRPGSVCDGTDGVLRKVREVIRAGADVIKICTTGGVLSERDEPGASQFLPAEIEMIVAEAHAAKLQVMAHAQGNEGIKNALRHGVRSIEHGIFLDDEAIDLLKRNDAFLVPTLLAPKGVMEAPDGVSAESLRKAGEVMEVHRESIARAAEAGVRIAMGTDSGVVAHGRNGEELAEMVAIGMRPADALQSATRIAAENLGIADVAGTIEPGKLADLIVLDGDPLDDIGLLSSPERVVAVWRSGEDVTPAA